MLGRTLQPPAEAFTPLSPKLHPDLTTRQRVELQTSPENCQVCHAKINALGFTLENFDAVGRYRLKESGRVVNASGGYTDRNGRAVSLVGADSLAKYLANSDDARRAFIDRAFEHFVKQPIAAFGADILSNLDKTFVDGGYNLRKLLVEIAVIAANPR